jgi:hypothetical protein
MKNAESLGALTNAQIKLLSTQRLRRMTQLIEQDAPVGILVREFANLTKPAVDEYIRRALVK